MIRFLQTPTPAKKFVIGAMLVLFCVILVITLVPNLSDQMFGGAQQNVLARVGQHAVTYDETLRQAQAMVQGRGLDRSLIPYVLPSALELTIRQQALIEEARQQQFAVSDEELRDVLRHDPRFASAIYPGDKFIGQEKYEDLIQQNVGISAALFESQLKDDLLVEKLTAKNTQSAAVTDAEVQQAYKEQNVKVKLQYAVLTEDSVAPFVKVTEPELKAFFDAHKGVYSAANSEARKIDYVVVDADKISGAKVTDADVQSFYNQHREDFHVADQVKVSHILVKVAQDADQKTTDAAKAKAESILKQLKSGANFETLAKKDSDDPGSGARGGSLGWIQRGQTVPEFEQAAFSLDKGQMSGLVKSSFGFHIIRVEDKQTAHAQTLDEVKDQIRAAVTAQKRQSGLEQGARNLEIQARSGGLQKVAADQGTQVFHSGFIAPTDVLPGVNYAPELLQAVFSAKPKSAPQAMATRQAVVLFVLDEVKPPAEPDFAKLRDRVERDFKSERTRQLVVDRSRELADKARAQHDLAKIAKEMNATLKTSELVGPNDQVPDIGSMQGSAAFQLKQGEIGGPVAQGNKSIVFSVLEKQEPSMDEFPQKKDSVRETMLGRKRDELVRLYTASLVDRLEKEGKIKKYDKEIDRLLKKNATLGG